MHVCVSVAILPACDYLSPATYPSAPTPRGPGSLLSSPHPAAVPFKQASPLSLLLSSQPFPFLSVLKGSYHCSASLSHQAMSGQVSTTPALLLTEALPLIPEARPPIHSPPMAPALTLWREPPPDLTVPLCSLCM